MSLVAGALTASAVVAAPFLWLSPSAFLRSTFVYGARPFQVEGLVGAASVLLFGKSAVVGGFGSYNVTSPAWLGSLGSLLLPLGIGGATFLAWRQAWRTPASSEDERAKRFVAWTTATLAIVLVTSKVLSPQYLIWLVPLGVVTAGKTLHRWAIGAAALTQLFYPILYDLFVEDGSRTVALIVTCRNVVLVGLAVAMVRWALRPVRARAPQT